jgi:hypothetical protein
VPKGDTGQGVPGSSERAKVVALTDSGTALRRLRLKNGSRNSLNRDALGSRSKRRSAAYAS